MFCVTLQESNTLLQICRNGLTEKQQKGFAIACLSLDSILVPATTLCVFVLYEDLQKKTRKDHVKENGNPKKKKSHLNLLL